MTQTGFFFSQYFAVPKKDGGIRPIMDLRQLNEYIFYKKFCVLTLDSILPLLSQGNWFTTIDLKDAYFHISIQPSHQRFLLFRFQHTTYQFAALPFGLSTAPRTFTKCMAPVVAYLCTKGIKLFPYINDWLLVARTYQDAITATASTLHVLHKLGLQINWGGNPAWYHNS